MDKAIAVELKNITKAFGTKVVANKNVNLTVYHGEVLSILGENGSGKTTLMNILDGIYAPDEGKIFIDGKETIIRSPRDAFDNHIGMVHQHFKLVDIFSAADNIILGEELKKSGNFLQDVKAKIKFNILTKDRGSQVKSIAQKYGFEIDLNKKIYDMAVSEKQTVEIMKVLYRGADILILDEPTAVLTPQEIAKLFAVIRKMKEDGKSIIIITHKLNEVMEISDRVAILRKGEHVATVNTAETNEKELTDMMVGKKISLNIDRSEPKDPVDRLIIRNLSAYNHEGIKALDNINFTVRSGEILGIAGIAGSGQKELLEAIAGLQPLKSGELIFNRPKKNLPVSFFHKSMKQIIEMSKEGKFHYEDGSIVDLTGKSPAIIKKEVNEGKILFNEDDVVNLRDHTPLEIKEMGVRLSFVPEDRLGMGLVGSMDLIDNMMLRSYRKGDTMFLNRKKPEALAEEIVEELKVVTPNLHTPVRRLSGGNVQKVLLGREISSSPKVLMAAYPVRGLDINSSYVIYNLLNAQKEKGVAIIFVGEDLDVLMALCDRIMVICDGKITGIVDGRTANKEHIGMLMTSHEGVEEGSVSNGGEENANN